MPGQIGYFIKRAPLGPLSRSHWGPPYPLYIYIFRERKKVQKKEFCCLKSKKFLVDIKHCDFTKYINIKRDRSNKGPKFDEYEEKL